MAENSGRDWIWRSVAEGTVGHIWATYALPALLPIGASAMTVLFGWYANPALPLMYIWVAVLISFAAVSGAILWLDQTIEKGRVKNKLSFSSVNFVRNIRGPGVALGVALKNDALVPVEFKIEEARTRVNNRVPSQDKHEKKEFIIPPNGIGWFNDHIIEIDTPPSPGTLEGFIEFRIRYGRPGNIRHDMTIKKQVVLAFNADGHLEHGFSNDAA